MPTLLPDRHSIEALIRMANVLNVVEAAFRMLGKSKAKMAAKTDLSPEHGGFDAISTARRMCGCEIRKRAPENPYHRVTLIWKTVEPNESGSQNS